MVKRKSFPLTGKQRSFLCRKFQSKYGYAFRFLLLFFFVTFRPIGLPRATRTASRRKLRSKLTQDVSSFMGWFGVAPSQWLASAYASRALGTLTSICIAGPGVQPTVHCQGIPSNGHPPCEYQDSQFDKQSNSNYRKCPLEAQGEAS